MKTFFYDSRLDFIGFSASMICAIHCLALPFLISALPIMGLTFLSDPTIEYSVIVISFILAVLAISQGHQKHHHNSLPIVLVVVGFVVIAVGLIWGHRHTDDFIQTAGPIQSKKLESDENPLMDLVTPIGAIMVSIGHYVNWLYIKRSKSSCTIPTNK